MENKTSKYFKYAVGEIILVVIGILIALQINNWNENRKLRKTEVKLLSELKDDLLKTRMDLLTDLAKAEHLLKVTDSMYLKIVEGQKLNGTFQLQIPSSYFSESPLLFPKLSAYKSIEAFGVNTISNDSLRKQITDFFELQLKRISYVESLNLDLNENKLKGYLQNTSIPANNCSDCESLQDLYQKTKQDIYLISNPNDQLTHMLKEKYRIIDALKIQYDRLNRRIEELVQYIDLELVETYD
ncbi:DUF6090 family protein [Aegicerativicinus sediminis]